MKYTTSVILVSLLSIAKPVVLLFGQSVTAVEKVTITVADLEQSVAFYTSVLDFQYERTDTLNADLTTALFGLNYNATATTRIARLSLGQEHIELMEFSNGLYGRSIPADSRSNDLWFQHIAIVVSDMQKAYEKVRSAKVTHVSTAPQTLPAYIPAAAGITAFYFRDPDGHNLELIHYPAGKGNPRWQEQVSDNLFLGIDHTAIGIEDTDRSLPFYTQCLNLYVAGNSENYGSEQEHLNQVFGARLLITGLQSPKGFGVEFLDYIAPPGGRMYPVDSSPVDLWHWHTTLSVKGLDAFYTNLTERGYEVISKRVVRHNDASQLLVRDPDGHAILLKEETGPPGTM